MVEQVLAGEGADLIAVAGQVCRGQRDDLAVSAPGRECDGSGEELRPGGVQDGGRGQHERVGGRDGLGCDGRRCRGVAVDESSDQGLGVLRWHGSSVVVAAGARLTPR